VVAIGPSMADVVRSAGGWLFDLVMAGWDATILTADGAGSRPARVLGSRACGLEDALARPAWGPCLRAIAVQAGLYDADPRVSRMVDHTLEAGPGELRLWGDGPPEVLDGSAGPVRHQLSVAARAFKAQALAALPVAALPVAALPVAALPVTPDVTAAGTETFRRGVIRHRRLVRTG
jgi:hypothetical protein